METNEISGTTDDTVKKVLREKEFKIPAQEKFVIELDELKKLMDQLNNRPV